MVPWREIKYSIGQWLKHYPIRIIKKKNVKSGFRNSLLLIFFQAANWLDSDWTSENKGSDHSRVFHFFRFVFDSSFPSFNYFFSSFFFSVRRIRHLKASGIANGGLLMPLKRLEEFNQAEQINMVQLIAMSWSQRYEILIKPEGYQQAK